MTSFKSLLNFFKVKNYSFIKNKIDNIYLFNVIYRNSSSAGFTTIFINKAYEI